MRRDTHFENARDELFAHVNRCKVLNAPVEQQREWMEDTMVYMAERFTGLTPEQLEQLREIGLRFCQPVIPHGRGNTALTANEPAEAGQGQDGEAAAEVETDSAELETDSAELAGVA